MHIFFQEDTGADILSLSQEESRHCAKVLRLKAGQEIGVVDGKGTFIQARLLDVNARETTASVVEREMTPERDFYLHMVVAPTKNIDRFEWFLEKATECGVEEITPIICSQSERKVVKTERLQKILIAAMKQSQRTWLPKINDAVSYKSFIEQLPGNMPVFIAHCGDGEKISFRKLYEKHSDALILIGPEGDFSPPEIELAMQKGAKAISLGNNRLRTETAALVACMEVNFLNDEL